MVIKVEVAAGDVDESARSLRTYTQRGYVETPMVIMDVSSLKYYESIARQFGVAPRSLGLEVVFRVGLSSGMRRCMQSVRGTIAEAARFNPEFLQVTVIIEGYGGEAVRLNEAREALTCIGETLAMIYKRYALPDVICTPLFYGREARRAAPLMLGDFIKALFEYGGAPVAISLDWEASSWYSDLSSDIANNDLVLDNYLCVDFGASNPAVRAGAWLDGVLPVIREAERNSLGKPIVVSGVNVKASRTGSVKRDVPARDMASFALGLDLFGVNHRPLLIRARGGVSLFSRRNYYYISLVSTSRFDSRLEAEYDPQVLRFIANANVRADAWRAARAFNAIVQNWEATVLRLMISELGVRGLVDYLLNKPGIASDKIVRRALMRVFRARRLA